MQSPKVIISGGGTGGHIFPAIAIADEIKAQRPLSEILFVGAENKMEMEKVPSAGYKIEGLWISGIERRITLKNLSFPFKVISSLMRCNKIIKNFKPDIAIGVGGFASGPLLKVATHKKIPTLIQEQNSYPGITNKILGKNVDKICVAYSGTERFFPEEKILLTGNPVRANMVTLDGKDEEARKFFRLNGKSATLLIVGGSLGAKSINEGISEALDTLSKTDIEVIWQTGKPYFETAKQLIVQKKIENVRVFQFISRMDLAYAAADVIVSRAGAIAISELSLVKKPVILVPYPYAAEDHQTKNAMALVDNGAAILLKDANTKKQLEQEVISLVNNKEKQEELRQNISEMGHQNATKKIVEEVFKLIDKQ